MVYVTQAGSNPGIKNYFDALYFTVATLTTTGFGDVTLVGNGGHILAVLIMIFNISLFLRLVQPLFRPGKVRYECPTFGIVWSNEFDPTYHPASRVEFIRPGHLSWQSRI